MKHGICVFIIDDHESMPKHLKKSIRSSFMGTDIRVFSYPTAWEAIEDSYMTPQLVIIDHQLGQVNGIDTISMLKQEYPDCKVIVLSLSHDIKEFSRALANGANRYIQKDQWTFKKVNRFIQGMIEDKSLNTKGYLIKMIEKALQMNSANRLAIIEGDPKLLFSLHYRLTKTLDMRVDPYQSLDHFYSEFKYFPDVMVLSDNFPTQKIDSADIIKLKTLKPTMRVIMVSEDVTETAIAEQLMNCGLDGFIHKDSKSFDLIERMIVNR